MQIRESVKVGQNKELCYEDGKLIKESSRVDREKFSARTS